MGVGDATMVPVTSITLSRGMLQATVSTHRSRISTYLAAKAIICLLIVSLEMRTACSDRVCWRSLMKHWDLPANDMMRWQRDWGRQQTYKRDVIVYISRCEMHDLPTARRLWRRARMVIVSPTLAADSLNSSTNFFPTSQESGQQIQQIRQNCVT